MATLAGIAFRVVPIRRHAGESHSTHSRQVHRLHWADASIAMASLFAEAAPKLRVGFVSTASIATKNLAAIRAAADRCTFAAVASRSVDKAAQWAAKHACDASVKVYGTYAELIADPDIDALYIPLPTALHLDVVLQAVCLFGQWLPVDGTCSCISPRGIILQDSIFH